MSRKFAADYGLTMPLIPDVDQKLALQYVGVDDNDFTVPGMIVIAPGGKIIRRKTGEAPGDRIYAAELIDILDREVPAADATAARTPFVGGYAPLERTMVQLGVGLGAADAAGGDGLSFTVRGQVAALYPVGRYVMLGGLVRAAAVDDEVVDVDGAVELRLPILYDLGAVYARVPLGVAFDVAGDDGVSRLGLGSGLALGLRVAIKPSLAIYLEAAAAYHRFGVDGADPATTLRYTGGGGVGLLF